MSTIAGGLIVFGTPVTHDAQVSLAWRILRQALDARVFICLGPHCAVQPRMASILKARAIQFNGVERNLPFLLTSDPLLNVADQILSADALDATSADGFAALDEPLSRLSRFIRAVLLEPLVDHVELLIQPEEDAKVVETDPIHLVQDMKREYSINFDAPSLVLVVRRES